PGKNPVYGNPLLADYRNATAPEDFSLQAGSPAIDKGVALGYKADFVNNPVPRQAGPDIGAFEYQPAGVPLAADGKAAVTIVLPPAPGDAQRFAGAELARYLEKISGAHFELREGNDGGSPSIKLRRSEEKGEVYTISRHAQQIVLSG